MSGLITCHVKTSVNPGDPLATTFWFRRRELLRCLLLPVVLTLTAGVGQNILVTSPNIFNNHGNANNSQLQNFSSRQCEPPSLCHLDPSEFNNSLHDHQHQLSTSEANGFIILLVPSLVAMVLNVLSYRCCSDRLSQLAQAMSSAGANCGVGGMGADGQGLADDYSNLWISNLRLCSSCLSLSLIGSLLGGCFAAQYVTSIAHFPSSTATTVNFLLATFVCASASFNLSSISSVLLTLQILGSFRILCSRFSMALKHFVQSHDFMTRHFLRKCSSVSQEALGDSCIWSPQPKEEEEDVWKPQQPDFLDTFLQKEELLVLRGFHLVDILESAEILLGPPILTEVSGDIVGMMFAIYFGIYFVMTSSHLTFGLCMSMLVFQWLLRGSVLFISGQNISAEMDNIKRNLEGVSISTRRDIGSSDFRRLQILISRVSSTQFRPCAGTMDLNLKSGVILLALLTAYAIILAQTKLL